MMIDFGTCVLKPLIPFLCVMSTKSKHMPSSREHEDDPLVLELIGELDRRIEAIEKQRAEEEERRRRSDARCEKYAELRKQYISRHPFWDEVLLHQSVKKEMVKAGYSP